MHGPDSRRPCRLLASFVMSVLVACGDAEMPAGSTPPVEAPAAAPASNSPATAPEPEAASDLAGEWKVRYWDDALGAVDGTARVAAGGGSARVELRHPETGERFTLQSRSVERLGDRVTIVLEGRSPRSTRLDGLNYPQQHLMVPVTARELTFKRGDDTLQVVVAEREPADSEEITLELELTEEGALTGTWRYRGHRFFERDNDGYGRAGHVETGADDISYIVGGEGWTRPQPVIFGVLPIEDQLGRFAFSDATDSPNYPYPFGAGRPDKTTRTLFVFGRDLPLDPTRRVDIQSSDPLVSYTMLARPSESAGSPFHQQNFDRGWQKLYAGLPSAAHAEARELDAVIVRATFQEGVLPGFHELSFEGTRGSWLLQFGDNTAALRFARPVRPPRHAEDQPVFETTADAFSPEVVVVEVETRVALPVAELRMIVGHNGSRLPLGGDKGMVATRVVGEPRRYRTGPIHLSDDGGAADWQLAVRPGDRLFAKLAQPGLISVEPKIAHLGIHRTPAAAGIETLWEDAVAEAAACQGFDAPPTAAVEGQSSESIDSFLFNSGRHRVATPGWLTAPVQVGHHAAMLLLHQTFTQLMRAYDQELANLRSEDQIRAYRRYIEPAIWAETSAMSRIEVDGPDGVRQRFASTFDVYGIAEAYHLTIQAADRWVLDATRQAISRYRRALGASIAEAEGIDACDVGELLTLTGADFEAVAEVTRTRLMTLSEVGSPPALLWQPDHRARAWIDNVGLLADTVRLHEQLQEQDRVELTLAISVAAAPVGILGELLGIEAAIVASSLVDVVDLAMASIDAGAEVWRSKDEVRFALGAADVLGIGRLQRAEEAARGWAFIVGTLIANGAPMMAFDVDGVVKLGRLELPELPKWARPWLTGLRHRDAVRGRAVARELIDRAAAEEAPAGRPAATAGRPEAGPADPPPPSAAFSAMWDRFMREASDRERNSLFAWLEQAHAARQAGRALTELQRSTLATLEAWKPVRWRLGLERPPGLSEGTWQFVKRFVFRRDVIDLLDSGGGPALEQALSAGGRRGEVAREVLEFTSQRTPGQFLREIEARLRQRPSPGAPYLDQTASNVPGQKERFEAARWYLTTYGPHADGYIDVKVVDPNGEFTSITRKYDEGTATLHLKQAFRRKVMSHIKGVLPVSLTEKGVPTIQFMTLRIMKDLGIGFAGSGKSVRKVIMSDIANFRTCVELEWMRKTYRPEATIEQLAAEGADGRFLMHTHSVRYAKSLMAMAGYRVTGARVVVEDFAGTGFKLRSALSALSQHYSPARYGDVLESKADFLKRFGMSEQSQGANFFDIELTVEPIAAGALP